MRGDGAVFYFRQQRRQQKCCKACNQNVATEYFLVSYLLLVPEIACNKPSRWLATKLIKNENDAL